MKRMIIDVLRKKYEYEIAVSKTNIELYKDGNAPVGMSSNVVDAVHREIINLAVARDHLETLDKEFPIVPKTQTLGETYNDQIKSWHLPQRAVQLYNESCDRTFEKLQIISE